MSKEPTRRRLLNIARRMADGDLFCFSGGSPRITRREVSALTALGFQVQEDHGLHELHYAYMLDDDRGRTVNADAFKARLKELEEQDD
jgi:hypothetical protein